MSRPASRDAYSVDQVRRAEASLLATVPEGALMQRAAAGLASACTALLGGAYGRRVLVVAGTGSNGGDALHAAARLLRRGARVEALLLRPDAAHAAGLGAFRAAGGRLVGEVPERRTDRDEVDLVLDGIVGIGASGGLRPDAAAAWAGVRALGCPVVAVDVPSGIGVDDGRVDGPCVHADLTVTFGAYKVGLLVGDGARHTGAVELVDIGLGPHLGDPQVRVLGPHDVARVLRTAAPGPTSHKYTRGVVGVSAGSAQYPGAAVLAVAGASCGLAGMVRFVGPDRVADRVRARHPEVVAGPGRVQAWVVGSGGGDDAGAALDRARADGVPLVVDADALQHVTGPLGVPALLTPHAGELARMLDAERADVEREPLRHAGEAADRFGAAVLLKGHRTVVAGSAGDDAEATYVNTTGTSWLGTAGAGDVLAGLCGALLAALRPEPTGRVGAVAAWLHGAAATYAGRGGPVTAGDVAAALPAVVRDRLVADPPNGRGGR